MAGRLDIPRYRQLAREARLNTNRRGFVTGGTTALLAVTHAPALLLRRPDHDLVIRGGTVFDGTGTEGREADVAVSGSLITVIAPKLATRGREEIDARGLAVTPGFIDIHSHGDSGLEDDPRVESVVRQGITTMVTGADGASRATGAPDKSFGARFNEIDRLRPDRTSLPWSALEQFGVRSSARTTGPQRLRSCRR